MWLKSSVPVQFQITFSSSSILQCVKGAFIKGQCDSIQIMPPPQERPESSSISNKKNTWAAYSAPPNSISQDRLLKQGTHTQTSTGHMWNIHNNVYEFPTQSESQTLNLIKNESVHKQNKKDDSPYKSRFPVIYSPLSKRRKQNKQLKYRKISLKSYPELQNQLSRA